jgi:Protein of unknown function (DUF5818)
MRRIFLSLAGFVTLFSLTPAPVQSTVPSRLMLQTKPQPGAETFMGTILKNGETFVLNDAVTKTKYMLDNQDKLGPYEGKKVKITGRVDATDNLIHIETIQEIA